MSQKLRILRRNSRRVSAYLYFKLPSQEEHSPRSKGPGERRQMGLIFEDWTRNSIAQTVTFTPVRPETMAQILHWEALL